MVLFNNNVGCSLFDYKKNLDNTDTALPRGVNKQNYMKLIYRGKVSIILLCHIAAMEITSMDKRLWPGVASNIPYLIGLMILSTVAYFERSWDKLALYTGFPCLLLLPLWW